MIAIVMFCTALSTEAQRIIPQGIVYIEMPHDFKADEYKSLYKGIGINFRYTLDYEPLKWIGANTSFSYDKFNGLIFNTGFYVRLYLYEEFITVDALFPIMNMSLEHEKFGYYNTPFGFEATFFRGPFKLGIRELFYKGGVVSRLTLISEF